MVNLLMTYHLLLTLTGTVYINPQGMNTAVYAAGKAYNSSY